MPKLSRIPRVSIIIPFQRDEAAFEETLVSVLEHQPAGCEVIVAHNGSYADPFELADEVKFVVARSSNLVDLIRDGFGATAAQFVHIAGSGLTAQPGWLSNGLESFDDSHVAAIAPLISDKKSGAVLTAGWIDQPGKLCGNVTDPDQSLTQGCHLNAGFFRRTVLKGLLDAVAPAIDDPIAVGYAFGCLLEKAGWKTASNQNCVIHGTPSALIEDFSDSQRGQTLGAIRASVNGTVSDIGWGSCLKTAFLGNSSLGEALGYLRHTGMLRATKRLIDPECVPTFDSESSILKMPSNESLSRRAA